MKFILNNPTKEIISSLENFDDLYVYGDFEGLHYTDLTEITEEELPKGVVDLGLPSGLKWASCNIGASKPCDSGLLFQFGRVDGYAYGSSLGTSFEAKDGLIKTNSTPPTQSGKTYATGAVLDKEDDAAYVATKGKMRMPTAADIDELLANTKNQWCQCTVLGDEHTNHSVFGRLFTGSNGNKIFIPAAGSFDGTNGSFDGDGSLCLLCSSTVSYENADNACGLIFNESIFFTESTGDRYIGRSIRGVVDLPEITEEELPTGVVDLGLSVKWASCNIGANSPCESGLLFQFGRVDGYAYGSSLGTSFEAKDGLVNTNSTPPTESGKTYGGGEVLDLVLADDAAYAATNGKLRMPTAAEINELLAGTTNQVCQCTVLGDDHTNHTVKGRLYTSKTNPDAKIFIPFAGFCYGYAYNGAGGNGKVWSASVYSDDVTKAVMLDIGAYSSNSGNSPRYYAYSVRGVCK